MNTIYDNGLRFKCQQCSFCCGHSPGVVYLSYKDLNLLCNFYSLSQSEFIQKNCRWVNYYYGKQVLALKEKPNYDCWLWQNGCSAYKARPVQCRTYPFWTWMLKDKQTWNECSKECPGMNKGDLHSFEEIELQRQEYESNKPIEKCEFEQSNQKK